jgi:hypothetical protein
MLPSFICASHCDNCFHGLPTERIAIGVVLNAERNVSPVFRSSRRCLTMKSPGNAMCGDGWIKPGDICF